MQIYEASGENDFQSWRFCALNQTLIVSQGEHHEDERRNEEVGRKGSYWRGLIAETADV